jgi:hypothetical protein
VHTAGRAVPAGENEREEVNPMQTHVILAELVRLLLTLVS